MLGQLRRLTLVGLVGAVSLLSVAQANARVVVSPGGAFRATGGTIFITITATSGVRTRLSCRFSLGGTWSSNVTAVSPIPTVPQFISPAVAPASPVDSTQGNVLITCTGGTIGGAGFSVTCDGRANIGITGVTVANVTPGRLTAISCVFGFPGCPVGSVRLTGAVNVSYNNATGLLTILGAVAGQSLTMTSTCATIPSGSTTLSSSSAGPVDFPMTVTLATTIVAT